MLALKITLEGIVASFRYPHFKMGVQPTFPMPPPATIYGHICSALGRWLDSEERQQLQFAYHFTSHGMIRDLEHIYQFEVIDHPPKERERSQPQQPSNKYFEFQGQYYPKALQGTLYPFRRDWLFKPRMILYINRPDWIDAFRRPVYPVILGRSQDLCWYRCIEHVNLEQQEHVYFEHALLPYSMATRVAAGSVTIMPRWIDEERQTRWARYLMLDRSVTSDELFTFSNDKELFWTDINMPLYEERPFGLVFHTFEGDSYETLSLA